HRAVAGEIELAAELVGEVALVKAFLIAPDGADHRWPRLLDDEQATLPPRQFVASLVDDGGLDAGERQRAGTRHQRRDTGQWGDDVAAGFGLPEGIHDRAALAADVLVVPHPGFGIDGL